MVARAGYSRWLAQWLLCAAVLAMLAGCGTTYVAHAARGQWQVLRERRPIAEVVADPATPEELRATLASVTAAREFASRELGLPDNGTYRSYTDLKRGYVVWNVVAAPEFSVTPQRWCFPIAGCVAYRGYFSEPKARSFAERLRRRRYDVAVGGVAAYSTLGRFADPVLSSMVGYGEHELAAILFHELSHQVVYVAGDSAFNEAFAVTVEQAGLERWLAHRGQRSDVERFRARRARQREYLDAFARRRAELAALYASDLAPAAMRERKREVLEGLAADLRVIEQTQNARSQYASWLEEGLNNAHLASVATYFDCVPGFVRLLAASGGDLQAFYGAVRELARLPRAERHARVCSSVTSAQPAGGEHGSEGQRADAEAGAAALPADAVDRQ
ncbi:MAG TPA: aminopeptidase [Steroidobacteraceae bacterium]|nr:aminopeptidase [Steroidobacteraceae bacterium]